jgi:hypothetical protein
MRREIMSEFKQTVRTVDGYTFPLTLADTTDYLYEAYYDDTGFWFKAIDSGNVYKNSIQWNFKVFDFYVKSGGWKIISQAISEKQPKSPMVTISEEEYHSLIEEINMLQELIVELSSVNTVQEQQAETYQELQKLLRNHHSFQDADGKNTTHAEELISTVKVLQSAYDRLASTPAKQEVITSGFKPISEYTLADWELACEQDWIFKCRNGCNIRIMETFTNGDYVVRGDDNLTRTIDGHWIAGDTDGADIVKRVK